jgi:carbon monoxide dehydrogenase subunit G
MRFRHGFVVDAPVDRVFAYYADQRNALHPGAETTLMVSLLTETEGVGSRYRVSVGPLPGGEYGSWIVEYLALDAPSRVVIRTTGSKTEPMTSTYLLLPSGSGTRIEIVTEFRVGLRRAIAEHVANVTGVSRRLYATLDAQRKVAIETWASKIATPGDSVESRIAPV